MEKYKDWQIVESIPQGWIIDKYADSPLPCSVFITNGKSPLNGQERAILKVTSKVQPSVSKQFEFNKEEEVANNTPFPAKTINELARKRFQEQLLKDILCDLVICKLEGWNEKEYIEELKKLMNSILP